jgi:hypothetical protein
LTAALIIVGLVASSWAAPVAEALSPANVTPIEPTYTVSLAGSVDGRRWTGTQSIEFRNGADVPLQAIWLRLWSNGVASCAAPPIRVSAITGGTAGQLAVGCTALPIVLDRAVDPGATGAVSMDVSISLPLRNDRFGYSRGLALVGSALPTLAIHDAGGWHLDPFIDLGESFFSVVGRYRVALTVPRALATPTTGALLGATDNADGTQTRTYQANDVRDFAWAAGVLSEIEAFDASNVLVRVWYRAPRFSAAAASAALASAIRSMNEFSADFGRYPYPELDLVLSPLAYGGMEYSTIVFTTSQRLTIAHEVAHQWWSGIVGNNQFSDPWLDETFASWAEALPWSPYECDGAYAWPNRTVRLSSSMAYWNRHPRQYWILYDQGTCALADAADHLGVDRFITLLREYAAAHWLGVSTVPDFKTALEAAAAAWAPDWDVASYWRHWRIGPA